MKTSLDLDLQFPLKDYNGDLEAWVADVEQVLSAAHQKDVRGVRERHAVPGCSKCVKQLEPGCIKCSWPKTVRYWRKVETGAKYAESEGYAGTIQSAPLAVVVE